MARSIVLAAMLLAGLGGGVQQPAQPQPLDWAADDGKRVAELKASGRRLEGTSVIVWAPSTFSVDDHRALVSRLDRGIASLRKLVGRHDWQVIGRERITYFLSDDRFVSHATARSAVFIPMARVQDGRAPLLHEGAHELLAIAATREALDPRNTAESPPLPLWFNEGLPEYLARSVAGTARIPEGDVFDIGGMDGVDRTCASRLKGPAGPTVLPFIGGLDGPDALFTTDRMTVAPTFYACSFSFTKFIVGRVGVAQTIALAPVMRTAALNIRIEKLLGMPMATARTEWLRTIGYQN